MLAAGHLAWSGASAEQVAEAGELALALAELMVEEARGGAGKPDDPADRV